MTAPPDPAASSVRPAGPDDAPAVGVVQVASWQEGYAGLLPAETLATLDPGAVADVWRRSLEQPPSPRHRLLVACAGTRVVGFAAVAPSEDRDADEHVAELLVLGVHPQARRAGHGARLVRAAAEVGHGWEAADLVAWVPRDDERTRGFLQRWGWVPDSAWRDRVVDEAGKVLREVRLVASVAALTGTGSPPPPSAPSR